MNTRELDTEFINSLFFSPVDDIISNIIENVAENRRGANLELLESRKVYIKAKKKKLEKRELQSIGPEYTDDLFKEHFKMTRRTCSELMGLIERKLPGRTSYFGPLPTKVIFTIWYLVTQEGFRASGQRFGFAKTTAFKAFREISSTLAAMRKKFIKFPDRNGCNKKALLFQRRSHGFPGVVGAIDACHILIRGPTKYRYAYSNENKRYSLMLQGICDHKGRFIDVYVGIPSQMQEFKGFTQTKIFKRLTDNTSPLLPTNLHIVADTSYPLLPSVMTPFRDYGYLNGYQHNFNFKLRSCHSLNSQGFTLLKSTFKRLNYLEVTNVEMGKTIISAVCTLHNFLIDKKEIDLRSINSQNIIEKYEPTMDVYIDEDVYGQAKRNYIAENLL